MITYCVSSAESVRGSLENLARTGRVVRRGDELGDAIELLRHPARCVVVAHGDVDGSLFMRDEEAPWLWVGMEPAPSGARVYLYSCYVGPALSNYLTGCECIGHASRVPMPYGEDAQIVIEYLDFVDSLMLQERFERAEWYENLAMYLGEKLSDEVENPTTLRASMVLSMLGKSIGMHL